jgi:uncharacterized protein YlaI
MGICQFSVAKNVEEKQGKCQVWSMAPSLVYELMANSICKECEKRIVERSKGLRHIGKEHGTWVKYLNDAFQAFTKTTSCQFCDKLSEKLYDSRVHINNVHQGLHFLLCRDCNHRL